METFFKAISLVVRDKKGAHRKFLTIFNLTRKRGMVKFNCR